MPEAVPAAMSTESPPVAAANTPQSRPARPKIELSAAVLTRMSSLGVPMMSFGPSAAPLMVTVTV